MIDINKNGITQEQFSEATSQDVLLDATGRKWKILQNQSAGEMLPTLVAQCPGFSSGKLWYDPQYGIVDEEYGIIMELNDPAARIIKNE